MQTTSKHNSRKDSAARADRAAVQRAYLRQGRRCWRCGRTPCPVHDGVAGIFAPAGGCLTVVCFECVDDACAELELARAAGAVSA